MAIRAVNSSDCNNSMRLLGIEKKLPCEWVHTHVIKYSNISIMRLICQISEGKKCLQVPV